MNLLIMRHAEAIGVGGSVFSDDERPLSKYGVRQAEVMGRQLSQIGWAPDLLLVSPLKRTRQTAEALRRQTGGASITISAFLAPSGLPPRLERLWDPLSRASRILLVGHLPDVAMLSTALGAPELSFSPGTIARFTRESRELAWHYVGTLVPEPVIE